MVGSTDRSITVPSDRIVAVGFLTQNDLKILGQGFDRIFPISEDVSFDDLLAKLESIAAVPERADCSGFETRN
jgi:hypothetical protein